MEARASASLHPAALEAMPPGAPSWITPELIADTIETWQPYYELDLTVNDALEILQGVGNLIDVLEKPA